MGGDGDWGGWLDQLKIRLTQPASWSWSFGLAELGKNVFHKRNDLAPEKNVVLESW